MIISRALPIAVGASLMLLTGVADATSTTCTTSAVCAEYINSSSGVAIHGEANTGVGIRGTSNSSTGFYGATRSGSTLFPGVEGESLDQTGDDLAGGFGLTAANGGSAPAYGILAYGSLYGVYGKTTGSGNGSNDVPTSFGVVGNDAGGKTGLDTNVAVYGETAYGTAVLALANVTPTTAQVFNEYLPFGIAAEAEPDQAGGNAVAVEAVADDTGYLGNGIALQATNTSSSQTVQLGVTSEELDSNGNNGGDIYTSGGFYEGSGIIFANGVSTSAIPSVRTTGSSGTTRIGYSATAAEPVMEDSGEGHLLDGRAYVKLDPALADVIDKRSAYRVFLTPEGDVNGLYVTQKSPAGFIVRESRGGHSTVLFDYRIIAKPNADDATRLALAPPPRTPTFRLHDRSAHTATPQQPLDPFARLQSHIGTAAYARQVKSAKTIEAGL